MPSGQRVRCEVTSRVVASDGHPLRDMPIWLAVTTAQFLQSGGAVPATHRAHDDHP